MQIIIDLSAKDDGVIHSNDEQKRRWEKFKLSELITKLYDDGYQINTLYGRFVFDEAKKEVIDCGEPGDLPGCYSSQLADSIFKSGGKLAIIFTDKKYIVFANRYFVAIHFCHMRKVRPISLYDAIQNYEELVHKENRDLLDKLYFEKFELYYGKDAIAQSCFPGDNKLHTKGFAVPAPLEEKKEKCHLCLCMPDGSMLGLSIYEGEKIKEKVKAFQQNWKKVTAEDPKTFGHKVFSLKCPKCGGEVHYCKKDDCTYYWCLDCDYHSRREKK